MILRSEGGGGPLSSLGVPGIRHPRALRCTLLVGYYYFTNPNAGHFLCIMGGKGQDDAIHV